MTKLQKALAALFFEGELSIAIIIKLTSADARAVEDAIRLRGTVGK